MSGVLAELAAGALAGRAVIAIGIGPDPIAGLGALGARVVGVISVVPAGGGPAPPSSPERPLLWIRGREREIFAHVVDGLARDLLAAEPEVAAFLARVDPAEAATVLSYLPVPRSMFGGRRILAQDSGLCRRLEDKRSPVLAAALAGPRQIAARWPASRPAWAAIEAELGATRLVVQALGLAGGGVGTRIVEGFEGAQARLGGLAGEVRVAAFVAGDPCNVMGLVPAEGPVIALPASVQIVAEDGGGCPIYAGNRIAGEDFSEGERAAIAGDVRAFGEVLRGLGFRGPFGLDFIRGADGRRAYHDLNPRMNGAVGLVAELVSEAEGGPSGLVPLLLGRDAFTDEEAAAVEASVADALRGRPRWRLFLSTIAEVSEIVTRAPKAGLWAIDPAIPSAAWVADEGALGGARGLLRPGLVPGTDVRAGDRVVIGDLSCPPALGRALLAAHGPAAPERLARAILRATGEAGGGGATTREREGAWGGADAATAGGDPGERRR